MTGWLDGPLQPILPGANEVFAIPIGFNIYFFAARPTLLPIKAFDTLAELLLDDDPRSECVCAGKLFAISVTELFLLVSPILR